MTLAMLALFTTAIDLSGGHRILLMLPLCLSVAVVYKTLRCEDLDKLARESLILWVTIVVGMFAVGVALWLLFAIMA